VTSNQQLHCSENKKYIRTAFIQQQMQIKKKIVKPVYPTFGLATHQKTDTLAKFAARMLPSSVFSAVLMSNRKR